MSRDEKLGVILFFGKVQCFSCYIGLVLNFMNFYVLGMNDLVIIVFLIMGILLEDKVNLGWVSFMNCFWDFYKFKVF